MIIEPPSFRRHAWILIAWLALGGIAPAVVVWWHFVSQRERFEAAAARELTAVADIKTLQLANWRHERIGDGQVVAASSAIAAGRRVLSGYPVSEKEKGDLLNLLRTFQKEFLYSQVSLLASDGSIRLQTLPRRSDSSRFGAFARAAIESGEVVLHDLYMDTVLNRPLMALAIPVDREGAYLFEIDPERFLYPYMRWWPGPAETAETLLFRLEDSNSALYLNELRQGKSTALQLRRPVRNVPFHLPDQTLSASVSAEEDYRGVPVLRCLQRIADSPWYLIAKIDIAEVQAPVRRLGRQMLLIMALLALLNAAGIALICRNYQLRMLSERETWFRNMIDRTPALLWMTGAEGTTTFINEPLLDFLGASRRSFGLNWADFLHPEDRQRVVHKFAESRSLRSEYIDEYRVRRADGEYRWVLAQGRPYFSGGDVLAGYLGAMLDITQKKEAEEAADQSSELLKDSHRLLERIAAGEPLKLTLDALVRFIERHCPRALGSILLLDQEGIHVHHGAAPSLPETFTRVIDAEPIGPQAGSCGTAMYRREQVITEDIASEPLWERYREVALRHGLRSCWSTPIFDEQQRVLGSVAVYSRSPGCPLEQHLTLIRIATHTAAIAISRDRKLEALRGSEERLRLAVANSSLGIWQWEVATDALMWSNELKDMLQWPRGRKEPDLNAVWDLVHRDDRERLQNALRAALDEHADYHQEYRMFTGDGSVVWIVARGRGLYDNAGVPVRMIGVVTDVTNRKFAEEEIERKRAQLAEAQRIGQFGSYEWDIAANHVDRSQELYRIYGLLPGDLEPTYEDYLERIHPADRSKSNEIIQTALRERKPFDFEERIVRSDNSVRWLHHRGQWILNEAHQPAKLAGTCHDVTERKETEEKLRAANEALAEELAERTRTEREVKALSARLISTQEEERSRIARELHDDLSQQIAAISLATSNLRKTLGAASTDALLQSERIQQKLVHLADGLRRVSHELHPATLQHAGLPSALGAYCADVSRSTGLRVSLQTDGTFNDVSRAVALCFYRVAQEALQNVVRHAKAHSARVELEDTGDALSLKISDDGVGIRPRHDAAPSGLGLISIRERARLVNGVMRVESQLERGTTLTLTASKGDITLPTGSGAASWSQ